MTKRAWLVLLLAGCGQPPVPDVVSALGVESFYGKTTNSGLTKPLADEMESELATGLLGYGYALKHVQNTLSRSQVQFRNDRWDCQGNGMQCDGVTYGNVSEVVTNEYSCVRISAYKHELLHQIQYSTRGIIDYAHSEPEWSLTVPERCDWMPF